MRFLSPEWIDALDGAARSQPPVDDDGSVVIEQVVDGDGGATWHLELREGRLRVRPGPHPHPDVRLSTDPATAAAISRGEASAQEAFMAGRLRLGGNATALVRHRAALALLGDLFEQVRGATDLPGPAAGGDQAESSAR